MKAKKEWRTYLVACRIRLGQRAVRNGITHPYDWEVNGRG